MVLSHSSEGAPYHGRFAPTPSGPLHFGSVVTALGSFLQARSQGGYWSLRFEDLDAPRVQKGAADGILRDLERLGLLWDREPVYQQKRLPLYEVALERLSQHGLTFACGCNRREVRGIYPGTCREYLPVGRRARSLRLRTPPGVISFRDRLLGPQSVDLRHDVGDFILRRADGVFAYHLAVVVDDAEAGITEIVRGADLLEATAPQIMLKRLLDQPTPAYMHLPLALNAHGRKISKQNHAPPIRQQPAASVLVSALYFLGQKPEPGLRHGTVTEILDWARAHWRIERVPRQSRIAWQQLETVSADHTAECS